MNTIRNRMAKVYATIAAASMVLTAAPVPAAADPVYNTTYTVNAELSAGKPGVYVAKASAEHVKSTHSEIGIPSIAKQNLASMPTTESPAIIQGAAVPFEKRVNTSSTIRFDRISDEPICAPYSKFRYELMEENDTNGPGTHTKITGFDGTYVIIRVDVSELIENAPEGSYLHYYTTDNKAMLVATGLDTTTVTDDEGTEYVTNVFSDGFGGRAGCYPLDGGARSLTDDGAAVDDNNSPYIDIILLSSGANVEGADRGQQEGTPGEKVPKPDFPISFYVDTEDDYNEQIIWDPETRTIIDKDTREVVQPQTDAQGQVIKTPAQMMIEKYYNEDLSTIDPEADVSSYLVKGDDLELEVEIDEINEDLSTKEEYWSLQRAMDNQAYSHHEIKLLCEVPMLEGFLVEDTEGANDREVVLDVNSFDIQIANNTDTGEAGLTVRNATLTIKDGSNTTGAELAVGNNASMIVTDNGKLVIDETCQLEVEFDSSSTPAPAEGQQAETPPEINNGVFTVDNGGEIVNNGIITVEGKEGKAQDSADAGAIIRDYKNAELTIGEGGTLTNNGCVLCNGALFNRGKIVNNGRYDDVVMSDDPDKGIFTYHKGIQLSWKDDITQGKTNPGSMMNGKDSDNSIYPGAVLENKGDIVLVPGYLENCATINNSGNIYMTAVNEVVIPITASQDEPTVVEERIDLGYYEPSDFVNWDGATINNTGIIQSADIEIVSNGRTGNIRDEVSPAFDELEIDNLGTINNSESGDIAISRILNDGRITGTDDSTFGGEFTMLGSKEEIITDIVLTTIDSSESGVFIDSSKLKKANVYNGYRTTANNTDTWRFAGLKSIRVSPKSSYVKTGGTTEWTVSATPVTDGEDIRYNVDVELDNPGDTCDRFDVPAHTAVKVTSPEAPSAKTNLTYTFTAIGIDDVSGEAVLHVNDDSSQESALGICRPTAMQDLMYNGKEQVLVTVGSSTVGQMQYSLDGVDFSVARPKAKDAGEYTVAYRIVYPGTNIPMAPDLDGTIKVSIAKRPLYIAANDMTSVKGADILDLTTLKAYTAYGIAPVENEEASLGITLDTNADKNTVGTYPINIIWNENQNYEFTDADGESRITGGVYYVSNAELDLNPGPDAQGTERTPGIRSDFAGYNRELKHGITLVAKYQKPGVQGKTVAKVYYSSTSPLDAENYSTVGTVAAPTFAAVGTDQKVWYYIVVPDENGGIADAMAGCQRVAIDKTEQKEPGIKQEGSTEGVLEVENGARYEGGHIRGLVPREMEYRRADEELYTRAVDTEIYESPGVYYVRRIGDKHMYPSPDTEITIEDPDVPLKLTFDPNGGTFDDGTTDPKQVDVYYGDTVTAEMLPAVSRLDAGGSEIGFLGWKEEIEENYFAHVDPEGNIVVDDEYEIMSSNIDDLVADWDIAKYTVIFDSKGGTFVDSQTVEAGQTLTEPEAPEREGFEFKGWKKYGAAYDFTSPVDSDFTLAALWSPGTYSVHFDANGGLGEMADQTFTFGSIQQLSENCFDREGYVFDGWNSKNDGKGISYADRQSVSDLTRTKDEVVTIYAKWKKLLTSADMKFKISNVEIDSADSVHVTYNGRPQKPNITVLDNTTDISKYCSFAYSGNTNAGIAKATITVNSTNAPYTGKRMIEFTIDKADLPGQYMDGAEMLSVSKEYISSARTADSIELSQMLPDDRGATTWTVTADPEGTIEFDGATAVSADKLSYTIKASAANAEGMIHAVPDMLNYNSTVNGIRINLSQKELGISEKVGKDYILCYKKNMAAGQKTTFYPVFANGERADRRVVFTSSNPTVANITTAGKLTAVSPGYTEIFMHADGDMSAVYGKCEVTVSDPVTSMTLNKTSHSMGIGEYTDLEVTVLPLTAECDIDWSFDNAAVSVISESIDTKRVRIIARKAGTTKVVATASDGSGKKAACTLSIGDPVGDFAIVPKGGNSLKAGGSLTMSLDWKGTKPKNTQVEWRIRTPYGDDASNIATITQKGVITGKTEGTVRVTAVSVSNPNKTASAEVAVYVPVKKVELNISSATISRADPNSVIDLDAIVTSTMASHTATGVRIGSKPEVTYKVDPKYAASIMVDSMGRVKAKSGAAPAKNIPVYATVTAFGGYSKTLTCKVTIAENNPLKSVSVSTKTLKLGEGNQAVLAAALNPVNPDGPKTVTWSSTNTGIAEVDPAKGIITAKAPGKCDIIATADGTKENGEHPLAKCTVTVVRSVKEIAIDNAGFLEQNGLAAGKSYTLKTKFTMTDTGSSISPALVWKSSDERIATVSDKGAVKAITPAKPGQPSYVTITVTSQDKKADGSVPSASVRFAVYRQSEKIEIDKTKLTIGTMDNNDSRYGIVNVVSVLPADTTNRGVVWTADNDNVSLSAIASEDHPWDDGYVYQMSATTTDGKYLAVRADKPGTAKLTGVAADGSGKKVSVSVTIMGQVTKVKLTESAGKDGYNNVTPDGEAGDVVKYTGKMKAGTSMKLSPIVYINGKTDNTDDRDEKKLYSLYKKYTNADVTYRSTDKTKAKVDDRGQISTVTGASGQVKIIVESHFGYSSELMLTVE